MYRCGIDIVRIARIERLLREEGFRERIFSAAELAAAEKRGLRAEFFAGRWAAKEAVAKALGCGFGKDCSPVEIEILPDDKGAPQIRLSGAAEATARAAGILSWSVSISHERDYATAMTVAETTSPR
ncbi:MAG: holo-ACP synthase [Lentisphaeria bacterium]|nr:holo-ACP synthase [Lentisphaeria bacterium]